MTMDGLRDGIHRQAQRIESAADYSSQAHFNTGAFYRVVHYVFGAAAAGLGALTTVPLVFIPSLGVWIAEVSGLGAVVLMSVVVAVNPGETAFQQYQAGNQYLTLRYAALEFLDLDVNRSGSSLEVLDAKAQDLQKRLDQLNETNGNLWKPRWAFHKADRDIRAGRTAFGRASSPHNPWDPKHR